MTSSLTAGPFVFDGGPEWSLRACLPAGCRRVESADTAHVHLPGLYDYDGWRSVRYRTRAAIGGTAYRKCRIPPRPGTARTCR